MKNQTTENQMPVVNTINLEVQTKIEELQEDSYAVDDMMEFISVHGEANFLAYYEEYVKQGEEYDYAAVDAFVDEFGIQNIESFQDAYYGQYDSEEEFAEQYTGDVYGEPPAHLVIDWQQTWATNLSYDFTFADGYIFNSNF
jgi:hypothetical protein